MNQRCLYNVCLLCVVTNSGCDNMVDKLSAVKVSSMCDYYDA